MVRPAGKISLVTFADRALAKRASKLEVSVRTAAILMISCIGARQRGQAIPLLLLARSDTTRPQHSYLSRKFATNPTVGFGRSFDISSGQTVSTTALISSVTALRTGVSTT